MMCEHAGPGLLVRDVLPAEEAGFDFAAISAWSERYGVASKYSANVEGMTAHGDRSGMRPQRSAVRQA
jgi:hypothetical protein